MDYYSLLPGSSAKPRPKSTAFSAKGYICAEAQQAVVGVSGQQTAIWGQQAVGGGQWAAGSELASVGVSRQ